MYNDTYYKVHTVVRPTIFIMRITVLVTRHLYIEHFLSHIWHWRSRSIASQNNRDLNQSSLHLWYKFGNPSLDFQVKFDLEGQGRSVHKTIGTLTKVFCIFGPNLVILAWTGPESSRGQASDWHTDRQTDKTDKTDKQTHRRRQRQYPKVKTGLG